jgi:hypothetical protein
MSKSPAVVVVGSLASLTVAIAAGALFGCSSTSGSPPLALSAEGESCARTADCVSGLVCIGETCVTKGSSGPVALDGGVVFAREASAPAAAAGVEGGASDAATPSPASGRGEACSGTNDCGAGLVCVASASGVGGTCDVASYGLAASGKTCSGECATGADCCELPLGTSVGTVAVRTCQDILTVVLGGSATQCASATPSSDVGVGCFLYATYCSTCAARNVWSCSGGQCVYGGTCQSSGVQLGGCPGATRTGRPLSSFCDTAAGKCQAVALGVCNVSGDCEQKASSDGAGTCRGGDCTCYEGSCYIACASTLDCAQGYACNTATKLCTQGGTCSSDAQCAVQLGVLNAKCVGGGCKVSCTSDRQCSGSGLLPGPSGDAGSFGGKVCGGDGFCQDLGCATDADCQERNHNMNPDASTVNYFCVTPPAAPVAPVLASAITD